METGAGGVIGGVFGLQAPDLSGGLPAPPFARGHVRYFLSVRCALMGLCQALNPRAAWLPSYLCGVLADPFTRQGIAIKFYGVSYDLTLSSEEWITDVNPGDLVLVIHYFGFPHRAFPAARIKERGACIVEDASQALFLPQVFPESSCILYSPRKFLGVPDGGVLVSAGDLGLERTPLAAPPQAWWKLAVAVSQSRRDADLTAAPANGWYRLFQEYEASYPVGLYGISELSRMLLEAREFEPIRSRRRANYLALLETLSAFALYPEMPEDVVPLGFPVRVDAAERDGILNRLYGRRIYAPVHWRLAGVAPATFTESHELSRSTLTLICDQRYTPSDMAREAAEFRTARSHAR